MRRRGRTPAAEAAAGGARTAARAASLALCPRLRLPGPRGPSAHGANSPPRSARGSHGDRRGRGASVPAGTSSSAVCRVLVSRASRLFTSTPNSSSVRFPRRPRRGEGACPCAGRGRWRPPPPVTGRHRRVQGEGRRGAESPTPVLWRGRQRLHSATGRRSQCPRDIPPGLGLQTHRPLSVSSRD